MIRKLKITKKILINTENIKGNITFSSRVTTGNTKNLSILINIYGNASNIRGNVSNIEGDVSNIKGDVSDIYGDVSNIYGNVSDIYGDVSNIYGDVTGIEGDTTGIYGDINNCELTDEERKKGVNISDLIEI